jgi:hypothetical protein
LTEILKEDQRGTAPVAQLVLGKIGGNGIEPGGELPGRIEAIEVTVHPEEGFLHQVLGPLPVPDHPVDEVEQPDLIAVNQNLERPRISVQVRGDQLVHLGGRGRFRLRRRRRLRP